MSLQLINVLTIVYIIHYSECLLPKMGPVGTIKVLSIETCEGNDAGTKVSMKNNVIGADLNLPDTLDDSTKFSAVLDVYNNGVLVKNFKSFRGDSCTFIKKNAPKGYESIAKMTTPSIPSMCPLPKGKYKIAGVSTVYTRKEINLPAIFYGKFIATVQVTKNNKVFCCIKVNGESLKK